MNKNLWNTFKGLFQAFWGPNDLRDRRKYGPKLLNLTWVPIQTPPSDGSESLLKELLALGVDKELFHFKLTVGFHIHK